MLNQNQRQTLLKLARDTMVNYLTKSIITRFDEEDPVYRQKAGAFVTIHKHGALRGCIGMIEGARPLYETIITMAIEASTADPRFKPVGPEELGEIDIEISVLYSKKKVKSIEEIELGRHGVIVRRGFNSGVFLPQVAVETGWDKKEFMEHLCSGKAGLEKDAYLKPGIEIYVFEAEVFKEKKG